MSFGPSKQTSQAQTNLAAISPVAMANSQAELAAGRKELAAGDAPIATGTSWLNTILHGNAAETGSLLAPQVESIRRTGQNNLQAASTLTPRGGGRSAALFGQTFSPAAQIQNLFNTTRAGAANALPQIGLAQKGLGANLFSIGNQPLNTAVQTNTSAAEIAQRQQQMTNSFWSSLGAGVIGLGTAPLTGGGGTLFGGFK
jgi:hypothetical protein